MNDTKEKHATHTPGPWHAFQQTYNPSNKGLFEVDANHPSGNRQTIAFTPYNGDGHEMWANARLIAAAPEMYEQCKLFEKVLCEGDLSATHEGLNNCDKLAKVREILAKVDGGEG
jgi:hypothetical protein